jgi:hypothetical protein
METVHIVGKRNSWFADAGKYGEQLPVVHLIHKYGDVHLHSVFYNSSRPQDAAQAFLHNEKMNRSPLVIVADTRFEFSRDPAIRVLRTPVKRYLGVWEKGDVWRSEWGWGFAYGRQIAVQSK